MDASIMNGKDLSSGAVSAVRCIANPIKLARLVMEKVYAAEASSFLRSCPRCTLVTKRGLTVGKPLRSLFS